MVCEAVVRVVEQDVAFADHVEDVARRWPAAGGVTGWKTGSLSAGRSSDASVSRSAVSSRPATSYRSSVRERPGRRILLLAELHQQQLPQRRRHRGVHLDPHHLGEPAVPDLLLDQAEQVFGLVAVVDLQIGVAGDPERCTSPRISTPGNSASRLAPITCSSGTKWFGLGSGTHRGRIFGHLHPGEALLAVGAAQHHGEREAEVRDVGEGMAGIDRERRQDREDVGVEVRVDVLAVGAARGRRRRCMDREPVLGQRREHVVHQARGGAGRTSSRTIAEIARELVLGVMPSAVRSTMPAADLLLEAGHAHLEELVEVAAEDARGT